MIKHYSDSTENITFLRVIASSTSYDFKVCYSVPISAKAGDIIQASFRAEITTTQTYTLQTGSFIVLGSSPTDTAQSKSILPAAGENTTLVLHHQLIDGACAHTFVSDFTGFVNVVLYSNSTAAGSDHTIEVMPGYGRLDVLHFSADATAPVDPHPDGGITLTAAQRQQILAALQVGEQERVAAMALLQ